MREAWGPKKPPEDSPNTKMTDLSESLAEIRTPSAQLVQTGLLDWLKIGTKGPELEQGGVLEPPGYQFSHPTPPSMKAVRYCSFSSNSTSAPSFSFQIHQIQISDIASTDINWKMLTMIRPENKIEEQYFTKYLVGCGQLLFPRLVELERLRMLSRRKEEEEMESSQGVDPDIKVKMPSMTKGAVIETFFKVWNFIL